MSRSFSTAMPFCYDSRVNSRYHNNPNDIINLGLPFGKTLAVNSMVELTPNFTLDYDALRQPARLSVAA